MTDTQTKDIGAENAEKDVLETKRIAREAQERAAMEHKAKADEHKKNMQGNSAK